MLAIFLLNPRGHYHFRLTMQRYENFMTLPNLEWSEFTLLSTKICSFAKAVTVTVSVSVTALSTEKLLYIIYIVKFTPTLFSRKFETETVTVTA